MPIETLPPTPAHKRLQQYSLAAAILGVIQLIVAGIFLVTDNDALSHAHEGIAFLLLIATILACVPARSWGKASNQPGLFKQALWAAGLMIVQIILGFVGKPHNHQPMGPMIFVHFGLGFVVVFILFTLWDASKKQPVIVTNVDGSARSASDEDDQR